MTNLSRAQIHTACGLDGTAAGLKLTRVERTTDKAVTLVSELTAALKLTGAGHCAVSALVTR